MEQEPRDPEPAGELPEAITPQAEATMLPVWRRVLTEGRGAELTLPEAATLLGASVDMVRRRIEAGEAGKVQAFHDEHGRIRISASVILTPGGAEAEEPADAESMAQLWSELKAVHEQLASSRAEEARLQEELEAAEMALEYTMTEVANLWRVMTTRNLRQAARKASHESHEAGKIITLAEQRLRIRAKVADVRTLVRRRKWPWSLVS